MGNMYDGNRRYPQAVSPVPERSPESVLVTQLPSQLLSPLWPNFGSGEPIALLILQIGWDKK